VIVEELLATLGVHVDVESFLEAEGWAGKLKAGLVAMVGALGIYELHHMVKEVAELGDAANKSSQKLGISAESLQELGYAASLSEVSQASLEGAMFRLSRNLERLATHAKGPAADALKKLHLNAKELKDAGLEESLGKIADKFAEMPNGQQKAALAMQLFGGAGKKLIPFLNEGADGIKRLREEARTLGVVIGDEMAEKFEEFNDDQTRVSEAWKGFKIQIVSDLLPALHDIVTGMLEWLKANGEWIRGGLHTALETVITAFKVLGEVIGEVTSFFKTLFKAMNEHRELTEVVVGLILAYFMPALLGLAVALGVVAAEFFVINAPIILLASLITSLILLVNHWGEIWPVVTAGVAKAWDAISKKASEFYHGFVDGVRNTVNSVVEAFASIGKRIADAIGTAYDDLLYKTGELAENIWKKLKSIPVIGLGFRAAEATADAFSGPSVSSQVEAIRAQIQGVPAIPTQSTDSVPVGGVTTFSATLGDTSIVVNPGPGMDERKIGEIAAQKAAEAQRNMLSDAYDRMKGGRK